MGLFCHYHPPKPKDDALYNQKTVSECTIEELKKLRREPKYTTGQKVIQIILFLIFGIAKAVLAFLFALLVGPIFILLVSIWNFAGKPEPWRNKLKAFWAACTRIFLFLLGFTRIRYHGHIDPDSRFLIANHTCFFDGWLFLPFGIRPLGKKELFNLPVIHEMNDIYQGIPVDREKSTGVTKVLIDAASDRNSPLISIMPEGASTSGDYMFRFHLGAFLSDLPVETAAIRYTLWGTSRSISHISFFHHDPYHWIVFLGIPAMSVDIYFLGPMNLKTDGANDPRQFADAAALRIGNFLGVRVLSLTSSSIFKKSNDKSKQINPNTNNDNKQNETNSDNKENETKKEEQNEQDKTKIE